MKKLVLSAMLIGALSTNLSAQEVTGSYDDQTFNFGLKATPTISWLRVDADGISNDGIRIGFTYGLVTEFKFSSNYAFATGIDVSYRGGKFKYSLGNDDVSFTQKLQFLDVPVALKLRTNEIGYMKYYGTFGFLPGVIIKATESIDSESPFVEDRTNRSNQSDFTVFNIGLLVGAGAEYNLGGKTSITAGITYNNGIIDILKEKNAQMNSDCISLNLGVFF
jgi:opacity protein-like surface antigen